MAPREVPIPYRPRVPSTLLTTGFDPTAEFDVCEGDKINFVLRAGASTTAPPPPLDVERAASETDDYWRRWIGHFDKPTDWPAAVKRSLITVKAPINGPTGGIVAAPTCSLPEIPGGQMNWDYRHCWLRDATFSLTALLNAGYHEEAAPPSSACCPSAATSVCFPRNIASVAPGFVGTIHRASAT